ncbi:uncharacterized protein [Miscanthus floridulus]|uniref:uncharacterized protein n=1 Tax=Miscanthus floridulus TaxID=154761 RepID=UPI0034588041
MELQKRIKDKFKVVVPYKRVYNGKELAHSQLFGDWMSSFDNLYRFKLQIEESCPGSFVVIDHHTINNKIRFNRLFFAMKPCIDGFLQGCRPYLSVDSTFLTSKFRGQLCVACAVDGHNWMYPVAVGVIDSETNENWIWFMERLRDAIGSPPGLTFYTYCGQAVMVGVSEVFPNAEHRECMWHLVQNFKKMFHGQVFDDHLWASSYSWNSYLFEKHWSAMAAAKPTTMVYLQQNHKTLWTISQFGVTCKIDYVTNNLAKSFNNWIKGEKGRHLDDLLDTIRKKLLIKWNHRRKIARAWQVSGLPCKHALAYITSISREKIEDHVDNYYSVQKFRSAYEGIIPAIPDKSMWPKSDHGFFMHPPLLKSIAGRRRQTRFRGGAEGGNKGNKGRHQCPICHEYGHHWYTCKDGDPVDIATMLADRGPPKWKKKKATPASIETSIVLVPTRMVFPDLPPGTTATTEAAVGNKRKTTAACSKKSKSSSSASAASISLEPEPQHVNTADDINTIENKGRPKTAVSKKRKLDRPAMNTRAKVSTTPHSPAMGTRSKRKLDI